MAIQSPERLTFCASNNLLKYAASIISPWVDMLAGCLKRGDCALSMTDSSTSAGWHHKINFREIIGEYSDPVQAMVRIEMAHHHATLFLKVGIKEYSYWFLGWKNNVADALLHDFDCSDDELTQILYETCSSQLHSTFK